MTARATAAAMFLSECTSGLLTSRTAAFSFPPEATILLFTSWKAEDRQATSIYVTSSCVCVWACVSECVWLGADNISKAGRGFDASDREQSANVLPCGFALWVMSNYLISCKWGRWGGCHRLETWLLLFGTNSRWWIQRPSKLMAAYIIWMNNVRVFSKAGWPLNVLKWILQQCQTRLGLTEVILEGGRYASVWGPLLKASFFFFHLYNCFFFNLMRFDAEVNRTISQ